MEQVEMGLWRIRSGLSDAWVRLRDVEAAALAVELVPASRTIVQIPVTPDEIVTEWMNEWHGQRQLS